MPPASAGKRWQDELRELSDERGRASPQPQPQPQSAAQERRAAAGQQRRAPLAIVKYPSPVLRAANEDVTIFDAELAQLARDMFNIMYRRGRCEFCLLPA
jgi:hypothetical protein